VPLNEFIDLYCERTAPGFWGEPLNAVTNMAYFAGAYATWRAAARTPAPLPASVRLLPLCLALVGVFSLTFHTLAVLWAAIADQLFILLFGCVFLYAFLRHAGGMSTGPALAVAVVFGIVSYFAPRLLPPGWLNRSGAYIPYLAGLLCMSAWLMLRGRAAARSFAAALALFCLALVLRTADMGWCERLPVGTHFLWHVLTGAVLALLTLALMRETIGMR